MLQDLRLADSDEVARAIRDDVAQCSEMMSLGVTRSSRPGRHPASEGFFTGYDATVKWIGLSEAAHRRSGSSPESTGGTRALRSDPHESGAAMRGGFLWTPGDDPRRVKPPAVLQHSQPPTCSEDQH